MSLGIKNSRARVRAKTHSARVHFGVGEACVDGSPADAAGIVEGTASRCGEVPHSFTVLGAIKGRVVTKSVVADAAMILVVVLVGRGVANTARVRGVGRGSVGEVVITGAVHLAHIGRVVVDDTLPAKVVRGVASPGAAAILDAGGSFGDIGEHAVSAAVVVVRGRGGVVPGSGAVLLALRGID